MKSPHWDRLYEVGAAQAGLFTTQQAGTAGYSSQLLRHYVQIGRIRRVWRGIYRIVHFPVSDQEDLAAVWLWSERSGVFSHQTALALQELSDALPAQLHLTLPSAWRKRRLRVPPGVVLHYANVAENDRTWFGPVPMTKPRRTLDDAAQQDLAPDLLRQAAQQALRRGLVEANELGRVEKVLKPLGGIAG